MAPFERELEVRTAFGDTIGQVSSNYDSLVALLELVAALIILDILFRVLAPWVANRPACDNCKKARKY
jgi:hypothetical protein